MASFKASMFIHLLLLTTFQHASNLVFADDELIQQQCHNADVPPVCIQCVKSDPRGETADKVGIAAIIINCLSNNAQTLANNMSTIASNVKDKDLKSLFQDCEKGFNQAKRDLSTATNELKRKDYDQTNHYVRTAVEEEFTCKTNVLSLKLRVPANVLYKMRVYEELSDAAMRIIDRF